MKTAAKKVFDEMNGFPEYARYVSSDEWRRCRTRFLRTSDRVRRMVKKYHRIICEFCHSDSKFNLHHKTYKRLGKERATDLIILCDHCHQTVHDLAKKVGIESATRHVRKAFLARKGRF
jgi:hypothetical protein